MKDDNTIQAEHAYDILFVMFLALLALGCVNIWMLQTMKKFRRPIVAFYASSLCVVLFRVILFMDQWVDYPDNIYVILLVSMPTYLYLITGMSQVMLSVECIVKYKNFSIRESEDLDSCQKKIRVQRNSMILQVTYIGILVFSLAVIFGFIVV